MAGSRHAAGAGPRPAGARVVLRGGLPRGLSPDTLLALHLLLIAKRGDLLELDARRRLHDAVQRFPGLHLRELARRAGLDPKHVEFHLRRLEAAALVTSRAEGGFRRYYPTQETLVGRRATLDPQQKRALAMLRRPVPLHIMLLLLDRGDMDHASIKEATGVAHGTVSYHLRNLESQGLVVARQDGRRRIFAPADAAATEALLLQYRPPDELVQGFIDAWESFAL